jgi:hypothetical protein
MEKKPRIIRVRHPDAEDDERGFGLDAQELADWRWVTAIEAAETGNLRELVRALLIVAAVPDWVRKELTPLFKDERALSDADRKLQAGVDLFRALKAAQAGKRRQTPDLDLAEQAAKTANTSAKQVYNVAVRHRSAAYERLRRRGAR